VLLHAQVDYEDALLGWDEVHPEPSVPGNLGETSAVHLLWRDDHWQLLRRREDGEQRDVLAAAALVGLSGCVASE
jgi:hypothetical protein